MADLKKYSVTVNGFETVLQLDEKAAKARGLGEKDLYKPAAAKPAAGKQAAKPENKQAAPAGDK